jgi:hypothetical protein
LTGVGDAQPLEVTRHIDPGRRGHVGT